MQTSPSRLDHLTFKGNLRDSRYGWLRLTPAYSVHAVTGLLESNWKRGSAVLDPFCGTGTTALVCAERGIESKRRTSIRFCCGWPLRKRGPIRGRASKRFERRLGASAGRSRARTARPPWVPPLHRDRGNGRARPRFPEGSRRAMGAIQRTKLASKASADLLLIAFCRTLIAHAHVSFSMRWMSFKKDAPRVQSPHPKASLARGRSRSR